MLFNSYIFIFVFLPLVLAVYYLVRRHSKQNWTIAWLVVASLVYYAWWKPEFLLLLLTSILVNAGLGKVLCNGHLSRRASVGVMTVGIVFNIGVLAYFKYAGFFVENLNDWFDAGFSVPRIILPIGISFITFQKIAFLVDAHRGEVRDFSFSNFALFVTFFPQLIAGPIVHHREVMPQFARNFGAGRLSSDLALGLSLFSIGLFKKVFIADSCAVFADAGWGMIKAGQTMDPASAWLTVFAFSFQIYYDFSGYSDMAVGLARMFGIRFPANFHSPYQAGDIVEFWRRWHMTLSRFLRDYLYIPLGGNRHGALRQFANLCVVMLLGGFWHGANWTFVLWGALHGGLLALNHTWGRVRASWFSSVDANSSRAAGILLTFVAVTLAWVPFRADSLADAGRMMGALFAVDPGASSIWMSFRQCLRAQFSDPATWFKARELWPTVLPPDFIATYRPAGLVLAGVAAATFLLPNTSQIFANFDPVLGLQEAQLHSRTALRRLDWKVAMVVSAIFVFSVLQLTRVSPFLYFQF